MGGVAQLAQVHDLLRAPDLMIGNYEGTLSRGGTPRCSGGPVGVGAGFGSYAGQVSGEISYDTAVNVGYYGMSGGQRPVVCLPTPGGCRR